MQMNTQQCLAYVSAVVLIYLQHLFTAFTAHLCNVRAGLKAVTLDYLPVWLTDKRVTNVFMFQYRGPPVAYIQQVLVKAAVSPWDSSLVPVDVFRSPLGRVFGLLEEIRNHVQTDR